ncbi:YARHG domain-containing protein [Cohaesibacter gelatinilyticus]|uniref:YARHG domain-containing protein n=1 Tax=Cohaesibacter gelatinilyticus TaxID=372072 RepID=UPI000BE2DA39
MGLFYLIPTIKLSVKYSFKNYPVGSFTFWELYVARNEIFARKGRPFVKVSSMCLQRHFDSWSRLEQNPNGWYNKKSGDVRLTDLEYRNAEIIRNYECKVRGERWSWKFGPCAKVDRLI